MLYKWINRYRTFWQDLRCVNLDPFPKSKRLLIQFTRIVILITEGFKKSQFQEGASSLTYYVLISIVPLIAFLTVIARLLQIENILNHWILTAFANQEEAVKLLLRFATATLYQTDQGTMFIFGLLFMIWTTLKIYIEFEYRLNSVWEVQQTRTLLTRFKGSLTIFVVFPLLITAGNGITIYLSTIIRPGLVPMFFWLVPSIYSYFLLKTFSIFITGVLISLLYVVLPNTNVRIWPAFCAGLLSGILYKLVLTIFLYFQTKVGKYNAIYGTFAALPLFLLWLHLSLMILLIGAKVAFALQNVNAFALLFEPKSISFESSCLLCLRIVRLCVKQEEKKLPPLSAYQLSNQLLIPIPLLQKLLHKLIETNILKKKEENKTAYFELHADIGQLTIYTIVNKLKTLGSTVPLQACSDANYIIKNLKIINAEAELSKGNISLKRT